MATTLTPPSAFDVFHPVYTIETIAALFHVSVDTAREYTYRADFPTARRPGARNLWDREEVLGWFRGLPSLTRPDTAQPTHVSATSAAPVTGRRPRRYSRRNDRGAA